MRKAISGAALVLIFVAACGSNPESAPVRSPADASASDTLEPAADPCSALPAARVEAAVRAELTEVEILEPSQFHSPPPSGLVSCAYRSESRYGDLLVSIEPMTRRAFEEGWGRQGAVREEVEVGEVAYFDCGSVGTFEGGVAVHVGIQYADCGARRMLVALTREALATMLPGADGDYAFVRSCETSVYGRLARNWENRAVTVGRVSFAYLKDNGNPGSWAESRGDVQPLKVLVIVKDGPPQTVQISPEAAVALQYDPSTFNRARSLIDGDTAVRFVPCAEGEGFRQAPDGETQFNGGLLASGPACATFRAVEDGRVVDEVQVPLLGANCALAEGAALPHE